MRREVSGFSLVEMLATLAVGSLLLLAAVSLIGRAGEGYDRGSGSVAAEREGRAALTRIAEDLATAVWHSDPVLEEGDGDRKLARLGFLSLQPPDAQSDAGRSADVCAIHYYVEDRRIGGNTIRCLMRGFRESAEVFDKLGDEATEDLFSRRDLDEPLAFGVVAFEAEPLRRDPVTRRREKWIAGSDGPVTAVRIKLVVARRELVGKLATPGDWNASPLLGDPDRPEDNRRLETYHLTQRFGNDSP